MKNPHLKDVDGCFVILRELERCETCRVRHGAFFSTHQVGTDPTKLSNGEVVYELLGFAETVEEAQSILYGAPR